jgi:hypothetical protein
MKELIALAFLLLIPLGGAEDDIVKVWVDVYPPGPILGTNSNNPTAWIWIPFYQAEPIGELTEIPIDEILNDTLTTPLLLFVPGS